MAKKGTGRDRAAMLAELLDAALAEEWEKSPAVIALLGRTNHKGEFQLAINRLDDHPVEALRGVVVGEQWDAVGLSSLGRVFSTARSGRRRPERVRITTAVSRDGNEANVLRRRYTDELQHLPPSQGPLPELLRNALSPSRLSLPGSWKLDPGPSAA